MELEIVIRDGLTFGDLEALERAQQANSISTIIDALQRIIVVRSGDSKVDLRDVPVTAIRQITSAIAAHVESQLKN